MDELHGHRALPDRRRHALDRSVADVAREEDPRLARFEWIRVALEWPRPLTLAVERLVPGEQEAVLVPAQPAPRTRRGGLAADQDEQRVRAQLLLLAGRTVVDDDLLEPPVPAHADD